MRIRQCSNQILMVRPKHFGYNKETASNNTFQNADEGNNKIEISKKALEEFNNAVDILQAKGIKVMVIEDTDDPIKPDAIFPNNWFSTHADGMLLSYPMYSVNRRVERRQDIIDQIKAQFVVKKDYSFEYFEDKNLFLEGTGSLVLDRVNKIAYACLSPRTDTEILSKWCVLMEYQKVVFQSVNENDIPIFHTNVMMSIGESVCVICLESIKDLEQRNQVLGSLEKSGKKIVPITLKQVNAFAGNIIQLQGHFQKHWIMAESAHQSLTKSQLTALSEEGEIITIPVPTIQKFGGGGIRCMIAGLFLDKK